MAKEMLKIISLSGLLMMSGLAFAEKYQTVGDFLNSGKIVRIKTNEGYKFAVKDKKGKLRTPFDYDFILPVAQSPEGILAGKNGKKGTLNTQTFQEKIPFIYDVLGAFNYKLDIAIASKDGRTGAIDAQNNIQIPFIYRMIALNLKQLQNYPEQLTIATPVDNQQDYLLITAKNDVLQRIRRPNGFENFYVEDFDDQLIALSDDHNNAALMDWQGNIILKNSLGKPVLNYNSVVFINYDSHLTTTLSYKIDEHGSYYFKNENVSAMTIQ